jgi:hypothetical protein
LKNASFKKNHINRLNKKKRRTINMKAVKAWMSGVLAIFLVTAAPVSGTEITAGLDLYSAYVWRGITFNDGLVAQPSMDVGIGNFNFNVWGNMDIGDYDDTLDRGEFSEIDLSLSYTTEAGPLSITGGYIEYLFPATEAGGALGTREIFLDVSGEPAGGFVLGVIGYYDIDEIEDYYFSPYAGYSLALDPGISLDFGASFGYAGKDFAMGGKSGFHEYTFYLGAGYAWGPVLLSGLMGYTDTLDKDVLPEGSGASDVNFFGGVGVSASF